MTSKFKNLNIRIQIIVGFLFFLTIIIILLLNRTSEDSETEIGIQPPTIHVTNQKKEINTAIQKVKWNGKVYEQSYPFKLVMSHQRMDEISFVPYGSEFEISFDGDVPDSVTIYDMVVTDNGNPKYDQENTYTVVLDKDNNTYRYKLEKQVLELSSDSTDLQNEKPLRGIMIEYIEGDNQCWYGFVIRTQ